ncbi:MAG: nucleotidyltransferase domain-containing protein [Desulfurococcaceae archaeon]
MAREKVKRIPEFKEVTYDEEHWRILRELRNQAKQIMDIFIDNGIDVILHGSIARGDVWSGSDIDIVIPYKIPSYKVELVLDKRGINPVARYIVIATPLSTPKAYIVLEKNVQVNISFPLLEFKPRELEFYRFGGFLTYNELLQNVRVAGVNKGLVLIEPTPNGHREMPVIGFEEYVARRLGISVETVMERVQVLTRRDDIGRTGVFAKYALMPDESFEERLKRIIRDKPILRRLYEGSF